MLAGLFLGLVCGCAAQRPDGDPTARERLTGLALPSSPQAADDQDQSPPPLAPGLACVIEGEEYSLEQYQDYLLTVFQRRWLNDFITQELLERAGAELGLSPTDAEIEAEVERGIQERLVTHYQNDEALFLRDITAQGHDRDTFRAWLRSQVRREMLQKRVALATREVTNDLLWEIYEREYGLGGLRVEVRHIVLTRAREKTVMQREGRKASELTPDMIEQRLIQRADKILVELVEGASFEDLARGYSHDNGAQRNGGKIQNYRFLRYGPAFADAVRAAPVGEVKGPVLTPTSVHLFEVLERVQTEFDDVRTEIEEIARTRAPDLQEILLLEERLRQEADVQTY